MAKLHRCKLAAEPTINARQLSSFARLLKRHGLDSGTLREEHAANKLLLDYDRRAPSFRLLMRELYLLELHPTALYYARSSSGKHWHVVIRLRERLPLFVTFFVQLYLGSDRDRERHNYVRAYKLGRTDSLVQILFEQKL